MADVRLTVEANVGEAVSALERLNAELKKTQSEAEQTIRRFGEWAGGRNVASQIEDTTNKIRSNQAALESYESVLQAAVVYENALSDAQRRRVEVTQQMIAANKEAAASTTQLISQGEHGVYVSGRGPKESQTAEESMGVFQEGHPQMAEYQGPSPELTAEVAENLNKVNEALAFNERTILSASAAAKTLTQSLTDNAYWDDENRIRAAALAEILAGEAEALRLTSEAAAEKIRIFKEMDDEVAKNIAAEKKYTAESIQGARDQATALQEAKNAHAQWSQGMARDNAEAAAAQAKYQAGIAAGNSAENLRINTMRMAESEVDNFKAKIAELTRAETEPAFNPEQLEGLKRSFSQTGRAYGSLAKEVEENSFRIEFGLRHMVAIFDESMRGQRGAMVASSIAFVRDTGLMKSAIETIQNIPMGGWGAIIAGAMAAAAAIYELEQAYQRSSAIREREVAVGFSGGGVSPTTRIDIGKQFDADRAYTNEWLGTERKVYEELNKLPAVAQSSASAIAHLGQDFAGLARVNAAKPVEELTKAAMKSPEALYETAKEMMHLTTTIEDNGLSTKQNLQVLGATEEGYRHAVEAIRSQSSQMLEASHAAEVNKNSLISLQESLELANIAESGAVNIEDQHAANLMKLLDPLQNVVISTKAWSAALEAQNQAIEAGTPVLTERIKLMRQMAALRVPDLQPSAEGEYGGPGGAVEAARRKALAEDEANMLGITTKGEQLKHEQILNDIEAQKHARAADIEAQIAGARKILEEEKRFARQKLGAEEGGEPTEEEVSKVPEVQRAQIALDDELAKQHRQNTADWISSEQEKINNEHLGTAERLAAQDEIIAKLQAEQAAGYETQAAVDEAKRRRATMARQYANEEYAAFKDAGRAEIEDAKDNIAKINQVWQGIWQKAIDTGQTKQAFEEITREWVRDVNSAKERSFQEFAAGEREKVQEARGDWKLITQIYQEWADKAAELFGKNSEQFKQVQREMVKAAQQAQDELNESLMKYADAMTRVLDMSVRINEVQREAQSIARPGTEASHAEKIKDLQEELADEEAVAQQEIQLYQAVANAEGVKTEEKLAALEKEMELQEKVGEKEVEVAKKIADEQKKAAEESMKIWKDFGKKVGDDLATLFEGLMERKPNALRDFLDSFRKQVFKTGEDLAAGMIGKAMGIEVKPGEGMGGLFSGLIGKLFGLDQKDPSKETASALKTANTHLADAKGTLKDILRVLNEMKENAKEGADKLKTLGTPQQQPGGFTGRTTAPGEPPVVPTPGGAFNIRPGAQLTQGNEPLLAQAAKLASAQMPKGYATEIIEGYSATGHVSESQHHLGNAIDVQLTDPSGQKIPNEGPDTTGMYQLFEQKMKAALEQLNPEAAAHMRWGGTFGARGGPIGPGSPADLMHIDLKGYSGPQASDSHQKDGSVQKVDIVRAGGTTLTTPQTSGAVPTAPAVQAQPQTVQQTPEVVQATKGTQQVAIQQSDTNLSVDLKSSVPLDVRVVSGGTGTGANDNQQRGMQVASSAGGLIPFPTSMPSDIKAALRGQQMSGRRAYGPGVNDNMGGMLAIVHPGEMIVPTDVLSAQGGMYDQIGTESRGFQSVAMVQAHPGLGKGWAILLAMLGGVGALAGLSMLFGDKTKQKKADGTDEAGGTTTTDASGVTTTTYPSGDLDVSGGGNLSPLSSSSAGAPSSSSSGDPGKNLTTNLTNMNDGVSTLAKDLGSLSSATTGATQQMSPFASGLNMLKTATSALSSIMSIPKTIGSIFGGGGLLGLFGLQHGGIIPSAAGGMIVPRFQGGGILSMLHMNEMVLPSHISTMVQNMAANGNAPGGGVTHEVHFNISAIDPKSGAQFLMNNSDTIARAYARSHRAYSTNVPRS